MKGSVELSSARLRLRRLRPDDAGAICAYRGLPEVARYQSWESFTMDDAARLIASQREVVPNTPGSWLQLALTLAESDQLVGDCGIRFPDGDERQVELGISLSPAHRGRGLAAEAIESVLRYAFDALGKHRAWAVTDAQNEPRGCSAASGFGRKPTSSSTRGSKGVGAVSTFSGCSRESGGNAADHLALKTNTKGAGV